MVQNELQEMLSMFADGNGFGDPEARRNAELRLQGVRSRQCQGFPRNPGRFHPESGLSPSLDQLGAIEREASFL